VESLEVLEKVNSFYSTAFGHLVTITLAVLAFSGVILPIIFQLIQARISRTEAKALQDQIVRGISAARTELLGDIEKKFGEERALFEEQLEDKLGVLDRKLGEQGSAVKGGVFFVQGKTNVSQGNADEAARDFGYATALCLRGKDEFNGQRALNMPISFLPKLDANSFDKISDLDKSFDEALEVLNKMNVNSRFQDVIRKITSGREAAKKREPVTPTSQASR
jgi:hypothetical protein